MNFKNCLLREFLWWVRSPSLWWSLPPLIIVITLTPLLMLQPSGVTLSDIEDLWDGIAQNYIHVIKQDTANFQIVIDMFFAPIEQYLLMPVEEIWQKYVVPPLQIWGIFPVAMMISPLAVALFNRDRLNGFYREHLLNGGNMFPMLLAKLIVSSVFLFIFFLISIFIYTHLLTKSSLRPEFFRLSDNIWLYGVLGGGLATNIFSMVLNWYSCLISRNNSTEVYTSVLITFGILYGLSYILFEYGMRLDIILLYNSSLIIVSILSLIPLSWLMRKEKFNFH